MSQMIRIKKLDFRIFYINIRIQITFVGRFQRLYQFSFVAQVTQLLTKVLNQLLLNSSFWRSAIWARVSWAVLVTIRPTQASQSIRGVSKVLASQWCCIQICPYPNLCKLWIRYLIWQRLIKTEDEIKVNQVLLKYD